MNEKKWVKIVTELDLPDSHGDYIVYTGDDATPEVIALYYCGDDNWDDGTGMAKRSWYGISHWRPLPDAPTNC